MLNSKTLIIGALLIIQLLLNDLMSFNLYFVPALFLVVTLTLPFNASPWRVLLTSFMTALLFDIISDGILGLYSASATFAGLIRVFILPSLIPNEMYGKVNYPAPQSIGLTRFLLLSALLYLAFMSIYLLFDGFGLIPVSFMLLRAIVSVIFNTGIITLILYFFENKR